MTGKLNTCHGCRSTITTNNHLKCSLCAHIYDLVCANVNEQRFVRMSKENISSWKCPECVSNTPKAGNINTPVGAAHGSNLRESHQLITQTDTDNVTVHRGSSGCNPKRVLDHSFAEDTYCLDTMRTVIRDEMERVMDERVSTLMSKLITEQVTQPFNRIISELTGRVATLESRLKSLGKDKGNSIPGGDKENRRIGDLISVPSQSSQGATGKTVPVPVRQEKAPLPSTSRIQTSSSQDELIATAGEPAGASWTEVAKKRHRSAPVGVIRGAAGPGSSKLEAAERRRQLHLYYVKVGTTAAEVHDHLISICGDNSYTVQELTARGSYASFKLEVPSKVEDSIMSPGSWPRDICVKPWRQSFRSTSKEGQ